MPFEVTQEPGYVLLRLLGDVVKTDLDQSADLTSPLLTAAGRPRLLVDASKGAPKLSMGDDYAFITSLQALFPLGTRIALLVPRAHIEHMEFVEDVARNSGTNLRRFKDRAEALAWLGD